MKDTQIHCIIHCRVSSTKQASEGESLAVQESICLGIVQRNGWVLAHKPWLEAFSGRKTLRPTFEEILDFLDAHPGKIKYYIFRAIDRFTRGGVTSYDRMRRELEKRGVAMIDGNGVIQPIRNTLEDVGFEYDWSKQSPSEITEMVLATTSKQEVTTILTRLIGQEIRLVQQGYKVGVPQDGFVNAKDYFDGKKRTIQVLDPERAKYYIAMFEMRASGQFTDKEIVERINAMGFHTRTHRRWDKSHQKIIGQTGSKPLTVKLLQTCIRRPIYCGVVLCKWTRYQPIFAKYPGLVSLDVFNAANRGKVFIRESAGKLEVLYDYNPEKVVHRRTRNNPLFPYKNVIVCSLCKKPFFGSSPKGKSGKYFPTYHCARGHTYVGIKKAIFDSAVEAFINQLRFAPDIGNSLRAVLLDRYRERQSQLVQQASDVGYSVAELEAQKAQALRAFIAANSDSVRTDVEREMERLTKEIGQAQTERNKLEVKEQDIEDFTQHAKAVLEHPARFLLNPVNVQQQQALYSLVFEEMPTYEEILNGTPKLTWVFNVSSESETSDSMLVRPVGVEPTTFRLRGVCSTS